MTVYAEPAFTLTTTDSFANTTAPKLGIVYIGKAGETGGGGTPVAGGLMISFDDEGFYSMG